MKKIAVDLDGVVFDSENLYRVYSEIYDIDFIGKDSLIDNTQRTFQKRYDWSDFDKKNFYDTYSKEILAKSNVMPGADIVLKRLSENYEIVIVTARNDSELDGVYKFLEDNNLKNVRIFNNESDKLDRFITEGIEFVIDDDADICIKAANNSIKALYFRNAAGKMPNEIDNLTIVNNWGEIYKYFALIKNK